MVEYEVVDAMVGIAGMMSALHDKSDPDFNVVFMRALLEGITEMQYWVEGERIIEGAFTIVPGSH